MLMLMVLASSQCVDFEFCEHGIRTAAGISYLSIYLYETHMIISGLATESMSMSASLDRWIMDVDVESVTSISTTYEKLSSG